MSKILTIAIPTYNRANFLDVGLKKILQQISGLEEKIEILVSDNCSDDNTEAVVKGLIEKGAPIIYNRNSVNLGMDGNFSYCFKFAIGKYVWLLGDDDYLLDDTLPKILAILEANNFGVIHLDNRFQSSQDELLVFQDVRKFIKEINYFITFISGNIVNVKSVSKIDFKCYEGTLLSQVPVYMEAAIEAENNAIVKFRTMLVAVDAETNGGYNIFKTFVSDYLSIIKEYRSKLGILWYEKQKYLLLKGFVYGWMVKLLIVKNSYFRFKTQGWFFIIFKKFWYEPYLYPLLLIFYFKKIKKSFIN